jgi:F5/8 type C domain-containing protein
VTSLITKFDRLALFLIIILGAVLFLVWARFPEYKSFGQGDPYLDANQYLPGKNFAERGFFKEYFLAEYATGPEECYPFWYTHNPSLSEIMSGLYYRSGLHKISQQRVIAILWNLLGAWFFYLLLKRLSGPLIALISLGVFISNPLYIAWGDNLFTNHQWCFAFAAMYFFLRSIDTAMYAMPAARSAGLQSCLPRAGLKSYTTKEHRPENPAKPSSSAEPESGFPRNNTFGMQAKIPPTAGLPGSRKSSLFLGLTALSFFLLCYSNYEYVPFVAIFFVGIKILKVRKVPWSRVLLLLGAGLSAVIIHQFWVIQAIGFDYWLIDKVESLLHRVGLGITPLMKVYNSMPCLMWEEQATLHGNLTLAAYWKNFYLHLENLFGFGWTLLLAGICIFPGWFLPGEKEERKILRRSLLLFFLMSNFWFVSFVQHTSDHQWGSTILLFAPFAAFIFGSVLAGLCTNFVRRGKEDISASRRLRAFKRISGVILLIAVLLGLILGRATNCRRFESYPGIKALDKYRGKYFLTSSIPTLVSAYTGTPTGWSTGKHPARIFSHSRYLVNPGCELNFQPDYFFSPRHPEDPEFARSFDSWLSSNFEIEEGDNDFTIYNLNKRLPESNAGLLNVGVLKYIRRQLPRAVWAHLKNETQDRRYSSFPSVKREETGFAKKIAEKILELTERSSSMDAVSNSKPILVRRTGDNLFSPRSIIFASSAMENKHLPGSLFDPDPANYWHISEDRIGEPAWIVIDFGEGREETVNFIRTRPRPDMPAQSFKIAIIQGSRDLKKWDELAAVIQEDFPDSTNWKGWFFRNDTPYRFYRFLIIDGHEADGAFYSLGTMEMYQVVREGL